MALRCRPYRRPATAAVLAGLLAGGLCSADAARAQSAAEAPAHVRSGEAATALQKGQLDRAIQLYSEALTDRGLSNDRRAVILNDRGVAYMRRTSHRSAIEDFNRAVQLYPEYAPLYNNRGNVLLALGAPREALKDFDRAIVLAPSYAAGYANRANAHLKLGQPDRAVADFTRAIEFQSATPAAFNGRGLAHLTAGRPHAAVRDFTRAAHLDSRMAAVYRNRAEAKLLLDHSDEAIEDLSRAIAFDQQNIDIVLMRADAYLATGNHTAALKDFSRAIELNPQSADAFAGRGFAYCHVEAFDEALNDLGRAIELNPRHVRAYAARAWTYKRMQQPELGQRDVDRALKLEPVTANAYWAQGEIEEAQGRNDAAIAAYTKALGVNQRHRETIEALARLGLMPAREEAEIANASLDRWRVIQTGEQFAAVNATLPGLRVPLEVVGAGPPKILEWDRRKAPYTQFGVLRFAAGTLEGASGPEEIETAALIDIPAALVLAMPMQRKGPRLAAWTWEESRVLVTTAEGFAEEVPLKGAKGRDVAASGLGAGTKDGKRAPGDPPPPQKTASGTPAWAPWAQSQQRDYRPPPRQQKPKSLFDLLFGN